MKNVVFALTALLLLAVGPAAQAAMQTYSIVDYPAYQLDTMTGLSDDVSGTITADPMTGVISSASFTITGGTNSYTVVSATIAPYYVHVTSTQITLTQTNPSNSYNYGDLRLSGSTGASAPNNSAVLEWYTPGNPWVPGSNNFPGYTGTVGSKGSGPLFASADGLGTVYPWVVATVVPEPTTIAILGAGLAGLLLRKRRRA